MGMVPPAGLPGSSEAARCRSPARALSTATHSWRSSPWHSSTSPFCKLVFRSVNTWAVRAWQARFWRIERSSSILVRRALSVICTNVHASIFQARTAQC